MCTSPQLVHGGLKGLSTIFKSPEHTFFCRIEHLFDVWLCRQKRQKTTQKKLSTKNILYYYNYYFHVPIKKGLRVGYARTRTWRPLLYQYTQCRFGASAQLVREEGSEYARKKSPTESPQGIIKHSFFLSKPYSAANCSPSSFKMARPLVRSVKAFSKAGYSPSRMAAERRTSSA